VWILGDQLIDDDADTGLGEPFGDPEVQRAHRVGMRTRDRCKGTVAKDDLRTMGTDPRIGTEALLRHDIGHVRNRAFGGVRRSCQLSADAAAELNRRFASVDHVGENPAQPLVRSDDAPLTFDAQVDLVDQTRPSASATPGGTAHDEARLDELGEVLPDRVVVETEVCGQFGDGDRSRCVSDVTKDLMTSRVAESPCLLLQGDHQATPPNLLMTRSISSQAWHPGTRTHETPCEPWARSMPLVAAGESPSTVTEALESLRDAGYSADYQLVDGALRAQGGNSPCRIDEAVVERFYRFEGPSDPGDQMIVFGLFDPETGVRGALAAAYGHAADPQLYEHLRGLRPRIK
jgi:hypothetical protein